MENAPVRIYNNTRCLGPKVDFVWKIHDFLKSFEYCNDINSKEIRLGDASFKMQLEYKRNETYGFQSEPRDIVCGNPRRSNHFSVKSHFGSPQVPASCPSSRYLCIRIERDCGINLSPKDHLMVNSDGKVKDIAFTVGILDNNGDLKYTKRETVCGFSSSSQQLLSEDELLKNKSTLLPGRCLTISCKIISWSVTHEIFLETKTGTGSHSGVEALTRDFEQLLTSESMSDVKILVNSKEIPVHSQILSARSPVFAAMFRSNMEENRTRIIDIKDVSELTVRYLLEYIYTGSLPDNKDMSADMLIEVYVAADKYSIMDLKRMMVDFIARSLSEDNMERYLSLGMKHEDQELVQSVSDFVTYRHEIIQGEIWQSLARKMPDFGVQVFERYCKRFEFM